MHNSSNHVEYVTKRAVCFGFLSRMFCATAGLLLICGWEFCKGDELPAGKKWSDVVRWTDAWDMADATLYDDDGKAWKIPASARVAGVADSGTNSIPLKRDKGAWGGLIKVGPVPGPKYVTRSARFNGRPAIYTDELGPGGFGKIYSAIATAVDPRESAQWFNSPHGYSTPYWCAVLCRPPNGANDIFGAWDAYNGHIGTTVTLAKGMSLNKTRRVWGMTTSLGKGDPWPSTSIEGSDQQTVLIIAKVDGPQSFLEINWRDAAGNLQLDRTTSPLANYTAKEIFMGFVHSSYVSAAGLKTGQPTDAELDAVRQWAANYLPATGPLPEEP